MTIAAQNLNECTCIQSRRTGKADTSKRVLRQILNFILIPVRFYQQRQIMAQLYQFSDHELRDIGLYRSDLGLEPDIEDDGDPTKRLARIVRDRQLYR